jgi:hypothetical protein
VTSGTGRVREECSRNFVVEADAVAIAGAQRSAAPSRPNRKRKYR